MSKGLIIAAPASGSGKTLVSLGLAAAMRRAGWRVGVAKAGPDYIDTAFLSAAAGVPAVNLDAWAMGREELRGLAHEAAAGRDLLLIEGVMGLFDGASGGGGSTGDLAAALGLPVLLVVDCRGQAQSVAAIVQGFMRFRDDVRVDGVVLNGVASDKHAAMLKGALEGIGVPCLGCLPRAEALEVPSRHLGLVMPDALGDAAGFINAAADLVSSGLDLDGIRNISGQVEAVRHRPVLPPLGRHVAVARDAAFCFAYAHWLQSWGREGDVRLSFFSPLADEGPDNSADAVFLPGGYPELHAAQLAGAQNFRQRLSAARDRGALIYGECGGFMALGDGLKLSDGITYQMAGLLPVTTAIDKPRRVLGYRVLSHSGGLPWPRILRAHEFHYSQVTGSGAGTEMPALFSAADASGRTLDSLGAVAGRVMGSFAHVISAEEPA